MEVLQRTANRGSIATGAAYEIDNSLKLETDNSEYMYFDGSSVTDYERTTFSIWIKRTELGIVHYIAEFGNGTANTTNLRILFQTDDTLNILGNSITYRVTNRVFRDTSAWYHLFFKFDTTQGFSNDRVRLWVNGVQETSFSTINNPGSGTSMGFNRNLRNTIGAGSEDGPRGFFAGYIAQAWNSGGTPPDVTDFGEFDEDTGIWKPIDISELSIPDSNGFYLDFSNSADLGNDSSSNNNDFTLNNITSADQALDTPTNNFCVVNAHSSFLLRDATGITEGATRIAHTNENTWCGAITTMGVTKGKWYWEVVINDFDDQMLGVTTFTGDTGSNTHPYQIDHTWNIYGGGSSGSYWISHINGTTTGNSSNRGAVWSAGSYIGVALDMDNSTLSFYHNGTLDSPNNSSIDISSLTALGHPLIPYVNVWRNAMWLNFGGYWSYPTAIASGNTDENGYGNFEYAPPSGYYALCSKNLAEFG
jgi:hypothetical protein